jgi:predicted enzyme related to lactoylglutathione lyase
MAFRYVHTNIIAKDWRRVSQFYQKVFRCRSLPDGERDIPRETRRFIHDRNRNASQRSSG